MPYTDRNYWGGLKPPPQPPRFRRPCDRAFNTPAEKNNGHKMASSKNVNKRSFIYYSPLRGYAVMLCQKRVNYKV